MTRPSPLPCPPHDWLLATPSGKPTVRGRCRKCKAKRDFPVSLPESSKPTKVPGGHRAGGAPWVDDTPGSLRRNPTKVKFYR